MSSPESTHSASGFGSLPTTLNNSLNTTAESTPRTLTPSPQQQQQHQPPPPQPSQPTTTTTTTGPSINTEKPSEPCPSEEKNEDLPMPIATQAGRRTWAARLLDDISLSYADIPVLACCMTSGLCDSVAFNAASVFVAMQTGNTIFLALGASLQPSDQRWLWLRALVSIVSFWLGCFAFGQTRRFGPRRKATLSLSFAVQAGCILVAAMLAQTAAVPAFAGTSLPSTHDFVSPAASAARLAAENDQLILLPLAFLAFQFGGQIVTSRVLGFNEVPTNVLTSVYCDVFSDPKLFAPLSANPKRNRRALSVILLVIGGVVGGWLQRSRAGMPAALWIAAFIKAVIAVAWAVWEGKEDADRRKRAGMA